MTARRRVYLATLLTLGCQSGAAAPTRAAPAPAAATGIAATPVAAAVTPMPMIAADPVGPHEAAAPWTLTASDGSGLVLTRVDGKAVVEGPLAFTELHLYFHNPEGRTREGTFAITLPSGAAVSRFAMETNGQWQEAEVVEKALARRAYDDFLHRRQDPALLEKGTGNQFTARVFPIPASADKHVVIAFSQELAGRGYTLPLRGLPKTERVDVTLVATQLDGSRKDQTLRERNWEPDRDFVAAAMPAAAAVTSGALVVGALAVTDRTGAVAEAPAEVTLLVDTSASRALGFAGYVRSIHALIDEMRARYGNALALQVIAFDQDHQTIFNGTAAGYGAAQDTALLERGAAGASNLGQVIATLRATGTRVHRRVVVVTDGVVTAGPDTPALVAAIKKLPIDRLDVVLAGGIRDERLAGSIVRAGLPRAGDVYDLDRGTAAVAAGLGERVLVDVAIEVPGATWVYPRVVPAARSGSTLMVYARMAKPTRTIDVVVGGVRRTVGLGMATPALVSRALAGAEIEELETSLERAPEATAKALRAQIAKTSVRARVISSQTSMLVLETDADYARYKIDRTALADILVVGPQGIEQPHRTTIVAAKTPSTMPVETTSDRAAGNGQPPSDGALASLTGTGDVASGFDDSNVYGGLLGDPGGEATGGFGSGREGAGRGGGGTGGGTIGTGRYGTIGHGAGSASGYGASGGRGGMRGRSTPVPSVALGQPTTAGSLDTVVIRRYIRRHLQKIRYCYEKELLARPQLHGVVTTRFSIDGAGRVTAAEATGFDPAVATCVAGVIKDIEFQATGAQIQVTYPFTFVRAQADTAAPAGEPDDSDDPHEPPLTGKLADVMAALRGGNAGTALAIARTWHDASPGDVLALISLGEALEAKHEVARAARIYGSIIDLYPARADFRRFAGERLERLGAGSRALVIDTYRRAVADRPDHVTGHRLLAYALVRDADYAGAFAAILAGIDQQYPEGRFLGAERVLAEDAGMIAAAYLAHGGKRAEVAAALTKRSLKVATQPSTRFIMYWETDANDVDFHIRDSHGGHAWYENKELPSGGELYADITTGYGPECFAIQGTPKAGPYRLSINYFSQGPMGYGMGLLQIQRFDGTGFTFDNRPYVIMRDQAFVELGTFD